jgi:hypothetical protein
MIQKVWTFEISQQNKLSSHIYGSCNEFCICNLSNITHDDENVARSIEPCKLICTIIHKE